jgi:Fe-S cluster biogenesis protein NfuA
MGIPIEMQMEPIDDTTAKFILSRSVGDFIGQKYTSQAETSDSAVAAALLEIPGIQEVGIFGNEVTMVKADDAPDWKTIEPGVYRAVNIDNELPNTAEEDAPAASKADDVTFNLVDQMFRTQINPALAGHGGSVELIDVQDGMVVVRMMGGCQGCGMARVTLQEGVEVALKKAIPAVKGVRDITDHAAGANPYTSAGQP